MYGSVSTPRLPRPRCDLTAGAALAQGAYYVVTGVWPFVSMRSFLKVTGPKTDLWLVKTVGGLVGAIGGALLAAGLRKRVTPELKLLGAGSATALAAIETFYVLRRRISPIYAADAVVETVLLATWAAATPRVAKEGSTEGTMGSLAADAG